MADDTPEFYRLRPVMPNSAEKMLNAVAVCGLCGQQAAGKSAGGYVICRPCGQALEAGKLVGLLRRVEVGRGEEGPTT